MNDSEGPQTGPVREILDVVNSMGAGIFAAWRRFLAAVSTSATRAGRWLAALALRMASRWVAQWPAALAYHRNPHLASGAMPEQARTAAAIGGRAFAFGLLIASALAATAANSWVPGVFTATTELLWAAMRFVIVALLMPPGSIDRPRLSVTFLASLVPYAFGLTPELRFVSLVASALLMRRGLLGCGLVARDARTAVGWAFGGQAAVMTVGWLARAALAWIVGI